MPPPPPPAPLRDSTPCRPKGTPLWYFLRNPFLVTDPKIFLKAPSAPIYSIFEGGARAEKTRFFCQHFSKSAQKRLFLTVFSKICLRRRKFSQNRGKTVLSESSKNQFGRPKKIKGRQNFRFFFENPPPPPRENPRSAPDTYQGPKS